MSKHYRQYKLACEACRGVFLSQLITTTYCPSCLDLIEEAHLVAQRTRQEAYWKDSMTSP